MFNLCIEKPFEVIKGLSTEIRAIHKRFEPNRIAENRAEMVLLYAQNLKMRERWDSNPRSPP
jgi:hypothetical protein